MRPRGSLTAPGACYHYRPERRFPGASLGRTIGRTDSQDVVSRDARAVSCASNHHYERVIGRCCTVAIEAYETACTTAKLAYVRCEVPPHFRNHSRRLMECLLEQPVGATGQRSRVSRARQYGECKQV